MQVEATKEEKRAVRSYALKHPGIRHRELAWRMVDEEVAFLSPSTVYRILKGENLVCPWRRRAKRTREEEEKASRPDEIWATDFMYLQISGRTYFLVTFLDEYSRQVVHHALMPSMDGITVSIEAQTAIERFLQERGGEIPARGMQTIFSASTPRPTPDRLLAAMRPTPEGLETTFILHASALKNGEARARRAAARQTARQVAEDSRCARRCHCKQRRALLTVSRNCRIVGETNQHYLEANPTSAPSPSIVGSIAMLTYGRCEAAVTDLQRRSARAEILFPKIARFLRNIL